MHRFKILFGKGGITTESFAEACNAKRALGMVLDIPISKIVQIAKAKVTNDNHNAVVEDIETGKSFYFNI